VQDIIEATFEPARGIIEPHSEQVIRFDFTLYTGGQFEEMFTCEIMDKEYPLAFIIKADVFGLQVAHELPEEVGIVGTRTNIGQTSTMSEFISIEIELSLNP
jgi:hypothetical protein